MQISAPNFEIRRILAKHIVHAQCETLGVLASSNEESNDEYDNVVGDAVNRIMNDLSLYAKEDSSG